MVLCLRNAFHDRSRYSLAPALVYQVARHPQSGFDRLFDATFKICRADSNEEVDLAISSFVSHVESEGFFTSLLTESISSFLSRCSSVDECVSPKEQVCTNGIYRCITSWEYSMYYFSFANLSDRGLTVG